MNSYQDTVGRENGRLNHVAQSVDASGLIQSKSVAAFL